jgi:hypothetical protein
VSASRGCPALAKTMSDSSAYSLALVISISDIPLSSRFYKSYYS